MVPVTNKLLIPCRVLDSHFCRLSDSVLTSPSRPPSSLSLPSQDSSSPVSSPFLNPRVSVLSHCPLSDSYCFFQCTPTLPPADFPATRVSPRVRDPPAQRPPPHPLDATFLGSLTPRALLSCFALIQKSTWAVCSYRCI